MKTPITILFLLLSLSAISQTTVTLQAGYSKSGDFHGAIGYKYHSAAIEAGFIAAPMNTDRPLYMTGLLMCDIPLTDNWNITPLAGVSYKYFTSAKIYDKPAGPVVGVRLVCRYYFVQYARIDKQNFFSIGMKPFTNAKKDL